MTIRNETEKDFREVEELTKLAFWNVNAPGCYEHYLVHVMRSHPDFIHELDYVIEEDGKIIANVMYTKAKLVAEDGTHKDILTFGPLSVHPDYQRKGYGKKLLAHSYETAKQLGYDGIVIFGNPENYICNGFKSCKKYKIKCYGGYPTALLACELTDGAFDGNGWTYEESPAYCFDEAKAEEFDKSFPQYEKAYRKSQELFYIYSGSGMRE